MPASPQTAPLGQDDRIHLRSQHAPVGRVLRELAAVIPITRLLIDPAAEGHMVALPGASGLRPAEALEAVLSASGLPYLVWGGGKGPWRVVLGDEASAVEVGIQSPETAQAVDELPPNASGEGDGDVAVEAFLARQAEQAEQAAAERRAEEQPIVVADAPGVPGGYTIVMENVTYHDPAFVPYKNRPEVQARRRAVDVTTIP